MHPRHLCPQPVALISEYWRAINQSLMTELKISAAFSSRCICLTRHEEAEGRARHEEQEEVQENQAPVAVVVVRLFHWLWCRRVVRTHNNARRRQEAHIRSVQLTKGYAEAVNLYHARLQ